MWLAKSLYEGLPVFFMIGGVVVALLALYTDDPLYQMLLLVPGLVTVTTGLVLVLRRHAYRSSRSRSHYDKIN